MCYRGYSIANQLKNAPQGAGFLPQGKEATTGRRHRAQRHTSRVAKDKFCGVFLG